MARYDIRLGFFVITAVCEQCGQSYVYKRRLGELVSSNYIPQPPADVIQAAVVRLQKRRNAALEGENLQDLSYEKCPNCKHTQSWMNENRVKETSQGITVILTLLMIGFYIYQGFTGYPLLPFLQTMSEASGILAVGPCIIPILFVAAMALLEWKVSRKIVQKMYQSKNKTDTILLFKKPRVEFEGNSGVFRQDL